MSDLQTKIGESFAAQGLMKTIGAQITHVAEGEVHIALQFSTLLSQQHGYVHAGAIASILDTACGYAALTKAPLDHDVVTAAAGAHDVLGDGADSIGVGDGGTAELLDQQAHGT